MRRSLFLGFILLSSISLNTARAIEPSPRVAGSPAVATRHHDNVLGTQCELRIQYQSGSGSEQSTVALVAEAERRVLAEIERLAAIVSTYDANSELSRWWSGPPVATPLSDELRDLLRACERWQVVTQGAFHPGVQVFAEAWRAGARDGAPPSVPELLELPALRAHGGSLPARLWERDETSGAARRLSDLPVTFDAIAKGWILDRACRAALENPGVTGAMVNIGGDLRVAGDLAQVIAITDPRSPADNGRPLTTMVARNQGVATSGGYERYLEIKDHRYSHLIDPRSGQSVSHLASVTVLAPDAADADALATALSVLSIGEGLRLADALPGVACLLVEPTGGVHRSRRWPGGPATAAGEQFVALLAPLDDAKEVGPWNGGYELAVELEINQAASGGRYRRPYVAAWIEDSDDFPVRTLALWVQADGPGPRWIPDLRRWYRSDRVRRLADDTDLVATISNATKRPGKYSLLWNGADDLGQLVKPGKYTLYIEAAREHGTYQLIRQELQIGEQPFRLAPAGNVEIKGATVEYRRKAGQ